MIKVKAGFDLTHFGQDMVFLGLLDDLGLPTKAKRLRGKYDKGEQRSNLPFVWSKPGLKIVTGCNPLTGKYCRKGQRETDVGYASYIGIEGSESEVRKAFDLIKARCEYYKEAMYGQRRFI